MENSGTITGDDVLALLGLDMSPKAKADRNAAILAETIANETPAQAAQRAHYAKGRI